MDIKFRTILAQLDATAEDWRLWDHVGATVVADQLNKTFIDEFNNNGSVVTVRAAVQETMVKFQTYGSNEDVVYVALEDIIDEVFKHTTTR